jgi:FlaA1/EpsC-like NDP-sugar epimerase
LQVLAAFSFQHFSVSAFGLFSVLSLVLSAFSVSVFSPLTLQVSAFSVSAFSFLYLAPMHLNLFDYKASVRRWFLLVLYTLQLTASLWLAYELRFDFVLDAASQHERMIVLAWLVPTQIILLALFHQLTPLLGYFSTPDLARVFHALTVSAIIASLVWLFVGVNYAPPRGVIVIDFVFALVGITGVRLLLRSSREMLRTNSREPHHARRRVAIIGAGDAGAVLAHELSLKPGLGLEPVAFFDDDRTKWHSRVHDIPVVGALETIGNAREKYTIEEAIVAMPGAPAKRIGEIVRLLRELRIPCKTVPSIDQLALGQVSVTQLRHIDIEDLLGRDKVELSTENIRGILQDKTVLVTGAGGSIGSELCRQILVYSPAHLILLDRSEPSLFQIEQELIKVGQGSRIIPAVADITNTARLREILSLHRPSVIFHAAAHKHVPMMEHQPGEAIHNNAFGTANLANLALELGVERFVMISTDKAINPTSVMGATKRLAEMYIQSLHAANPGKTKFMTVRFGNVLGSSGSVIPLFRRQIADGGPVRVTHPDMTRYFMTIPEASMLVLQSAMQGEGGEIFVLDMGHPIRIVDLARQMIELSGLKPDEDIRIEFCGTRPGEKLFEEITHKGENFAPTAHGKIFRFLTHPVPFLGLRRFMDHVQPLLHNAEPAQLKTELSEFVPDYSPYVKPDSSILPTITRLDDHRPQPTAQASL